MKTLNDIIGQNTAVEALRGAYRADRLPHGLIFSGPVGVGKATTAAALGGLFLCEKPKKDQACGICQSCRVFEAGTHPDFHVITKELIRYHDRTGKSKGIDLSKDVVLPEIVAKAAMKPAMGVGKVFIVEQAELMTAAAQNALLKTLEEPAGRALIVLLTDQVNSLLPTIRSRCQVIGFVPLDESVLLSELGKRGLSKSAAAAAARFAEGSLGEALRWTSDGVIDAAGQLVGKIDDIFAGKAAGDLPDWFKAAAEAYAEKQLERDELSSKDQATRQAMGLYLRLAAEHLRMKFPKTSDPVELERSCKAIEAIAQAERYLDANVNIPLLFGQLAMALES
jgi:DNA polymerase III subunit delta'